MLLNCGVGEDSWQSLDIKEIKQVNPEGNQPWIFIGRTDAEAEPPILWLSDANSWLTGKDPEAGKDWEQEENRVTKDKNRMTEDEMLGWHHQLNGHESEQTLGDSEGRRAWQAVVHGVTKIWTWLNDWTTTTNTSPLKNTWTERSGVTPYLRETILERVKILPLESGKPGFIIQHCSYQPGGSGVSMHLLCVCVCVHLQLCPTLSNPMYCSPPGSFVLGIFQARLLEWFAISFSNLGSNFFIYKMWRKYFTKSWQIKHCV